MKRELTRADLEAAAFAEYQAHVHKVVLVKHISGYRGEDSDDVELDPPLRVRVLPTPVQDIERWLDGWLDPCWDVIPVGPSPEVEGMRSRWIFATSRHVDGAIEAGDVVGVFAHAWWRRKAAELLTLINHRQRRRRQAV